MSEEKRYSVKVMIDASAALDRGRGTFHVTVDPEEDDGSSTTVTGEGNKCGILKAAYALIMGYVNAYEDMTFTDVMERLQCLDQLVKDTCDTKVMRSMTPTPKEP